MRVAPLVPIVATLWVACSSANDGALPPSTPEDGSASSPAAWGPEKTLSAAGVALNYNFGRSIAADGAMVYAVWNEPVVAGGKVTDSKIQLARSSDGGLTWGAGQTLSVAGAIAELPTVAASAGTVYAAWRQAVAGKPGLGAVRSNDGGATWQPDLILDNAAVQSVSIAANGANVRLAYTRSDVTGVPEVYTRASTKGASTWDAERLVSDTPYDSWVGTVELDGSNVYIAWVDYKDANEEEYFRASKDAGATWGPIVRLTSDAADSWAGSLAVANGTLYYAWFDRRAGGLTDADVESPLDAAAALLGVSVPATPPRDPNVYYLDAEPARWAAKQKTITDATPAWIARGGDGVKLQGFLDEFKLRSKNWNNGWAVYIKRSDDVGATWTPDTRVTFGDGPAMRPSLVVQGAALHMVWFDGRGGGQASNVYYKTSKDGATTWTDDLLLTTMPSTWDGTMRPSIAASADAVHVLWCDGRNGPRSAAYYRRFGR